MTNDHPIPKLRPDLQYQIVEDESEEFIILIDPKGYSGQPIAIPSGLMHLFNLIDGEIGAEGFAEKVKELYGEDANLVLEPFGKLLEYMDYGGFLDSEAFKIIKGDVDKYLASPVRPSVCAGNSYSPNPEELKKEMEFIDQSVDSDTIEEGADSIIVPHIDFRIGPGAHKAYASGYHALRGQKPDLVVIFGTAHYGNSSHFMFTKKDYSTPLGIIKTDKELIDQLSENLSFDMKIDDLAHRMEHSIELQTVLAQHFFSDKGFKLLPVLVGSFQDYIASGKKPSDDEQFNEFVEKLRKIIEESGRKAVFIASADFSHIGRKFNDDFDAEPVLETISAEDGILLDSLEKCNSEDFFSTIAGIKDKNRVCGLSPIYSMMKTCNPKKGKKMEYHQWNEKETKSAVTFASIAYYV